MREGWNYKRLIEVCDFQGGSQPPKEEWSKEPKPNYVRMLQIRDFTQSATDYIEFVKVSKSLKYCQDDDILLGRYGASVGKVLTGLSGAYNVAIIKAIPNVALVSKKYIKSYFLSPGFQLNLGKVSQHRAAQAGFSKDDIAGFPIPIPPIQEQEKIVAELDCLTGIIEKKKQQLDELDKLAQSIFYDMFGSSEYQKGQLISLCADKDDIKCGPFGTQLSKSEFLKDGVPVWGIPQVNSNFAIPPTDFVSEEKALALQSFSIVGGDIVMSRKGNIGQSAIYPTSFESGILHSDVLRIRVKRELANPLYLVYQFHQSAEIKHQFKIIGYGAIMPGLNVSKLKNVIVDIPPITLQNEFAQKIEAIEKQKELMKRSIVETGTLFNSRMDYWFN